MKILKKETKMCLLLNYYQVKKKHDLNISIHVYNP